MEVVKTGMQHGDLSLDAYTQVPATFDLCLFWVVTGDLCHLVTWINDFCGLIVRV